MAQQFYHRVVIESSEEYIVPALVFDEFDEPRVAVHGSVILDHLELVHQHQAAVAFMLSSNIVGDLDHKFLWDEIQSVQFCNCLELQLFVSFSGVSIKLPALVVDRREQTDCVCVDPDTKENKDAHVDLFACGLGSNVAQTHSGNSRDSEI